MSDANQPQRDEEYFAEEAQRAAAEAAAAEKVRSAAEAANAPKTPPPAEQPAAAKAESEAAGAASLVAATFAVGLIEVVAMKWGGAHFKFTKDEKAELIGLGVPVAKSYLPEVDVGPEGLFLGALAMTLVGKAMTAPPAAKPPEQPEEQKPNVNVVDGEVVPAK